MTEEEFKEEVESSRQKRKKTSFLSMFEDDGSVRPYLVDQLHDGVVAVAGYSWGSFYFGSSTYIVDRDLCKTLKKLGRNRLALAVYDPDEEHVFGKYAVAFDKDKGFPTDLAVASTIVKQVLEDYKHFVVKSTRRS